MRKLRFGLVAFILGALVIVASSRQTTQQPNTPLDAFTIENVKETFDGTGYNVSFTILVNQSSAAVLAPTTGASTGTASPNIAPLSAQTTDTGSTSSSTSTSGGPPPPPSPTTYGYSIGVVSPLAQSNPTQANPTFGSIIENPHLVPRVTTFSVLNSSTTGSSTQAGYMYDRTTVGSTTYSLRVGDEVPVKYTSAVPLSAGTPVKMYFQIVSTGYYWNGTSWGGSGTATTTYVAKLVYTFNKLSLVATSIDSRQQDKTPTNYNDSVFPDPAAPHTDYVFSPTYFYNGGLFVGHVATNTGDRSETSRMQLYVPATSIASSHIAASCISLFELGAPSIYNSWYDAGLFQAASTDPNIAVPAASATWDNAWNIAGITPTVHITLGAVPTEGFTYMNWQLGGAYTGAAQKYSLAMTTEPAVTAGPSVWRYFTSSAYQSSTAQFPLNDCAPKFWVLSWSSGW